jgi:hypothetical protein
MSFIMVFKGGGLASACLCYAAGTCPFARGLLRAGHVQLRCKSTSFEFYFPYTTACNVPAPRLKTAHVAQKCHSVPQKSTSST